MDIGGIEEEEILFKVFRTMNYQTKSGFHYDQRKVSLFFPTSEKMDTDNKSQTGVGLEWV